MIVKSKCPNCGKININSNPDNIICRCFNCYEYFNLSANEVKSKMYVSGPITGFPEYNKKAFDDAKMKLEKESGYEVLTPFDVSPFTPGKTWIAYMHEDLKALMDCDAIAMLPGWEYSAGATIEHDLAVKLSFTIIYLK